MRFAPHVSASARCFVVVVLDGLCVLSHECIGVRYAPPNEADANGGAVGGEAHRMHSARKVAPKMMVIAAMS